MKEKEDFSKVIADISILYELSLASGQSLDLKTNCDLFLKTLMARENLGYASVWIKVEYLFNLQELEKSTKGNNHAFILVYANPEFRVKEKVIPPNHPIVSILKGKGAFSIASSENGFSEIIMEKGIDRGVYAIFALGKLGLLKLFSMTRETPFREEQLKQLKNVISKFTISLEGCIAHQKVIQEINERKRAEEALRESEGKYRTLIDNIQDGAFIIQDAKIQFVNEAFAKMVGHTVEEVIGMDFRQLVAPEDLEIVADRYRRRQAGEDTPREYEFRMLHKDGATRIIVNMNVGLVDYRGSVASMGTVKDITERKRAEKALLESEERYRSLVETATDVVFTVSPNGAFTSINPAFEKITGWYREEWLGKPFAHIIHPDDLSLTFQKYQQLLRGEGQSKHELRIRTKSGEYLVGELITTPQIRDGKVVGILGIARDITERKQSEEVLVLSEERYRTLVEESFDGIFVQKGPKIIFANQRLHEMLAYDKGELEGLDHWLVYHPDYQELTRERARARMRGEKVPSQYEVKLQRKDGASFDGEINARAIMFDKEPGVQVWVRDITERKRAEEIFQASEANYRAIFNAASDAIFIHNMETGEILDVNRKMCEMYGYTVEEARRINVEALSSGKSPYTQEDAIRWIKKAVEGRPQLFEWMAKDKAGRLFWVEVNLKRATIGGKDRLLAIVRDITERKHAETALRRSEEESRNLARENAAMAEIGRIISSTLNIDEVYERFTEEVRKLIPFDRVMINIINPDKKTFTFAYIAGINMAGRQIGDVVPLAGTATEGVMRTRSSLLVQTENIEEVARRFPGLLPSFQAGFRSMIFVPLISKDQFIGTLSLRSTRPNAYTDQDTKVTESIGVQIAGAIANAQLFAEHIRSEEEKAVLQEQLRQSQKMEAIGQLAGGIAHDFNNLLTIIKGYSQLSLLDLKESDPLWGNIQEIQKATQRATDLTRQLLAFSRRQILDLKVIDLNSLLKDLDKMLRRIIGEDIELATLLTEELGRVKIDPGQFEQMILNLAVNARDAMPSGGKLTIETANVILDEEYAHTHIGVTPGPYVRLSVSDTGVGIPMEVKEKVFEPFFTTKEKGKGTGLGLSTVYGIVKQSGGNIWVYSEPAHGTTFKIYLPRVEEDLDTLYGRDESDFLPGGGETVLLVEDEPSVRDLAHRLLNQQGYKVLEAANGEEALHVAQEHAGEKIHLLLTDVVMPRMGGKELTDQLKIFRPDIKVLYASGYTDNAIVHHGVLERGTHFLQKPFSPSGLVRKVREVLDR